MDHRASDRLERFRNELRREYERRFPRGFAHHRRALRFLPDGASHAVRGNDPFMPVARSARGAWVEDIDGHRIVDYWQGHFANLLGHNPRQVCGPLGRAIEEGRGLQTGLIHEAEAEVAERICLSTGVEAVRLTTSGSLGVFYAVLLARSFTGRECVMKVAGGWHGSQPFGLKGVSPRGGSFDHLESEGLSATARSEVLLTRFNDTDDLRRAFREHGDRSACLVLEPVLGAGGGFAATPDYLREARRLTELHGALLVCDEIITAFRFHAGDASTLYGVRPDLLVLGKILGGGMPVAAVAGRREILDLCTRAGGRVKFEGGTYSAHELSLIASRAMLTHLAEHADVIYPRLGRIGRAARDGLRRAAAESSIPVFIPEPPAVAPAGGSLVMLHPLREASPPLTCPEDLASRAHPFVTERLLKATLLLEGVSTRSGLGAISTAHTEEDLARTLDGVTAGFARLRRAGLV